MPHSGSDSTYPAVQISGTTSLVEELAELDGAVALVALSDHLAGLHVQGGEEGGRAVPDIVVRAALYLARPHRQQRLRAVERLYL